MRFPLPLAVRSFARVIGAVSLLAVSPVAAAEATDATVVKPNPTLRVTSAGELVAVKSEIAKDLQPPPAFEAPPIVVKSASGTFLLATTAWSWWCSKTGNILHGEIKLRSHDCKLFSYPARIDPHLRNDAPPGMNVSADTLKLSSQDWRLNYSGAMSAVELDRPLGGYDVVAAVHGEDKNERIGDTLYANTVNTDVSPASCAAGMVNGAYDDCWKAYNAFISLVLVNSKSGAKLDLGPVVWPASGYVADGKKVSNGVRHPSLFLAEPYLYLYYLDTSHGDDRAHRTGIHVARIDLNAPPASLAAVPFVDGGFSEDKPSLPAGFDKQSIRGFYGMAGGRAFALWPNSAQAIRFSVTRIRKTAYFLGAEEYGSGTAWGVRLRLSRDLMHWSDPVAVPGLTASTWANGGLHYPVFSDAAGDDAQSIDPDDFYLVGSTNQAGAVRQHLSIRVSDAAEP